MDVRDEASDTARRGDASPEVIDLRNFRLPAYTTVPGLVLTIDDRNRFNLDQIAGR